MTITRLAILGATGSIGRQALEVARAHPADLRVVGLSARTRLAELGDLARAHGVTRVVTADEDLAALATAEDVDLVLIATPGVAGLVPTLAALRAGKSVALANKEVLVVGGHLVRALVGGAGARLRPVDSEHCALWQCLRGERLEDVRGVTITASGGALRGVAPEELPGITPERALRHPTWRMGPKVTIDAATLVNKGYEVVEAHWLYGLGYERIAVVLHPQSIVHALVEMVDGAMKAQLAVPDMRLPIQYALLGERHRSGLAERLDLAAAGRLDFDALEPGRYPCLDLVLEVARGGDLGAMVGLSAADELAVDRFLGGGLAFTAIRDVLARGAEEGSRLARSPLPELDEIMAIDAGVRRALGDALVAS